MREKPQIPTGLTSRIPVCNPVFVTETAIANIWKVHIDQDHFAALKIYKKPDMGNEAAGFRYLEGLNGVGAVNVLWYDHNTALTEWLDGPSLGDLTRGGQHASASVELVAVAHKLHSNPPAVSIDFPELNHWFDALFRLKFSDDCASASQRDLLQCKQLARNLIDTQQDLRPLHGDLHHDNIQMGTRGYCAFDAKGVLGERAFELANAFRNPKGADQIIRDPARINFLADLWSQSFAVDRQRLLQWASVKCALSMAWRNGPVLTKDPETDLLSLFLRMLGP
jgi:streptomycin 6-kinase